VVVPPTAGMPLLREAFLRLRWGSPSPSHKGPQRGLEPATTFHGSFGLLPFRSLFAEDSSAAPPSKWRSHQGRHGAPRLGASHHNDSSPCSEQNLLESKKVLYLVYALCPLAKDAKHPLRRGAAERSRPQSKASVTKLKIGESIHP